MFEESEQHALAAFGVAVRGDPARRAEAQEIARKLGTDPETAERNLDVMREQAAVEAQRRARLTGGNPVLMKELEDVEFARIAHDDLPNLGFWERLGQQRNKGALESEQSMLATKRRDRTITTAEERRLAEVSAWLKAVPEAGNPLEGLAWLFGQQESTLPQAMKVGMATSATAALVATAVGQMGPQVALPEEIATVPAAAITGFVGGATGEMLMQSYRVEGGATYLKMLEERYDESVARKASIGAGIFKMGLEAVGAKLLAMGAGVTTNTVRKLVGAEISTKALANALAKPTKLQALLRLGGRTAVGAGGEIGTENLQEAIDIIAEEVARRLSENPEALESDVTRGKILERLYDITAATANAVVLLAAAGPGKRFVSDYRKAAAAEQTSTWFKELGSAADASKVQKRNVGRMESFIAAAMNGTGATNTYVDGQAFAEVLRQADAQATEQGKVEVSWADQLDRAIPGLSKRVAEAAARGEDVVIPTAVVGAKIAGTDVYQALLPHLRLDADAKSLAQAQVFRQEEQERSAEAERLLNESDAGNRAFADSARQVEEQMREQLVAAGRMQAGMTVADVQAEAKFYRDLVIVQASRMKMLPAEWHAQHGVAVRAGELPEGQARRQLGEGEGVDDGGAGREDGNQSGQPAAKPSPATEGVESAGGPAPRGMAPAEPPREPAGWALRSDVPGPHVVRTEVVEASTRELGTDRVTTVEEAAQALGYLGRQSVEHFDALVTDKDGKPLAIVGSFKGALQESAVYPATIVAEAFRIAGAANIWFAHNHPTGLAELSSTDRLLHLALVNAFRGSTIQPRGLFVVGGGAAEARKWAFESGETFDRSGRRDVVGETSPPKSAVTVAAIERRLTDDGALDAPLTSAENAWQFARQVGRGEAGVILLDAKARPVAFVPVDAKRATTLRDGGRMDAIYRAVSVAQPSAAVLVDNGKLGMAGALNVARLLDSLDVSAKHIVYTRKGANDYWTMGQQLVRRETFQSGTRGFYRPRDRTIFLTKTQNGSTFVHELAHHYLSMLADLAREKAHPAILDDFRTLLAWFEIPDVAAWDALGFEGQEKHQEAFARSLELWLWEGKAPSKALEGLFARVARWMRTVYGTIVGEINTQYRRQFGVDLPALTPEVRAVMGRMVASEQEVEAAAAVQGMADTFTSQAQAGMDDATWAEHQALEDEARDQAVSEHSRANLREMQWQANARAKLLREKQKQHDATRAKVREEVEAEARKEPVHRARLWLERGELVDVDGGSAVQAGGMHKLQTEAVVALLPAGTNTKPLTGRKGILAKDGLLPDVAAKLFGFETGAELVQAVLAGKPFDQVVDARTDARMLAEFGDLVDPKLRELAVIRALHNEARSRLIAMDLKHISKALGPIRLLVQATSETAKRLLARKSVAEINPRDSMLAEARAARAFTEALKAGDIPAAVEAQKRRLLHHEMAKLASSALDEIDEGLDDFARFATKDEKLGKVRDIDLVYAGRALAAAFGLSPKITGTQERALVAAAREKLRTDYPAMAGRVDGLTAAGDRPWRDIPMETFRELVETGQALWHEAGKAKVVEHEGRRRQLDAVVGEGVVRIGELAERAKSAAAQTGKTPSPLARLVLKGWNVLANLKRFEHWAWFMDGGKPGWFAENIVQPLRGSLGRYWGRRAEVVAKIHPQVMALRKAAGALWDAEIAVPEADILDDRGGRRLQVLRGKKELIGMLLHAGSESNLMKLLVPYGFAHKPSLTDGVLDTSRWDKFLARMFDKGVLTQADVEFVRFMWGVYKELLPADQQTHKALYGFEFKTIELREFHTPFGTLEGGYVPAYVDQDKVQAPRPSSVLESLAGEEQNFLYSISTGRGHTLERNPNFMKPLALDVALQVNHIDAQLRFTYLQPAIAGILRILRNREFSDSLNGYDREAINSVILPMLDNAALQQSSRPSGMPLLDGFANWARAGTSLAALGFNFVNAVLQLTGFSNAVGAVPGRFMRAGVGTLFRNPRDAVRRAMEQSDFMRERLDQTTRILREDITVLGGKGSPGIEDLLPSAVKNEDLIRGVKKLRQAAGRLAFWPQRMLQGTVDVVTWHAAYQQHVAASRVDGSLTEDEIHAEAVAYADGVVKRTQGSANPEDLAAYESGAPLMKLMTQFGSYSNVVLNGVLGAQPGWSSKVRAIAWLVVVPALAEASLRALAQGVPDDDKDGERDFAEIAMLYAKSLGRNVTGMVPAVGPALLSLGESEGNRMIGSPAGSMLQAGWRGMMGLVDVVTGEEASAADARAIGTFATMVTGFPVMPVARAVGYDIDVGKGKARPTGTVDYLRGLLVGR